MAIDTLTLQSFLAAAETHSFTRAAERVGRTQSAVSQQIAKLEDMLGQQLFTRGKQIVLTPEGELFLGYAQQIFALHREAIDRLREPDLAGEVRFGLPEDFAAVFLSDVLAEFVRLHPRIKLKVECDLTLNLLRRFRHKEFDLVLVKHDKADDFPNGREVWTEHLEWVGAPGTELTKANAPIRLVLSPKPCVYRARATAALEAVKIPHALSFSSPSYAGTTAAVRAGMGITVLPRNMIPDGLSVLRTKKLPPLPDTHISILRNSKAGPAVMSLKRFVLQKLN